MDRFNGQYFCSENSVVAWLRTVVWVESVRRGLKPQQRGNCVHIGSTCNGTTTTSSRYSSLILICVRLSATY